MKTLLSLLLSFVLACGVYAQTASEFFEQALASKDNEEKIRLYTKAIEKNYSPLSYPYCNRGIAKKNLGKYTEAIQDYGKAIELKPDYALAYYNRGNAKDDLGKYTEAIQDYDKAIELNPDYAFAYNNRGNAKYNLGKYAEAIQDFDKAISLISQETKYAHLYYNNRGYAHFKLQNYAKAIEDWEAMQKVAPADYTPYHNYIDEARKKLAENNTIAGLQKQLEEEKKKSEKIALLSSTHSKRLALVIGNDKYTNQVPLANAQNDAMDMKKKLEDLGFRVLFYTNLDRVKMKNAIDDFGKQLANYEAGLVFYAGHGSQYKGENYLVPVDAVLQYENLVEDECLNVNRVLGNMEGAQSKINIVILDACRDNPYEKKWRSANKVRGNTNNGGLAKIEAENSQGLFIVFATSPDTASMDFSPCENNTRNGLFTGKLLPNLQKGVRIEDVFKRTKKAVRECSQNMQNPWNHSSLEGDFVF